ncbi:hypothetical protein EJB05_50169 [Eragrostis curvula]|uniref:Uncharacterized protein n=1 Tax=Eragrostis curvula TaxID=38414 RepID=A0A5J9T0D7_9POAL|nr:hypothetical protein EJB05_50169 [Eragrostis curvula]
MCFPMETNQLHQTHHNKRKRPLPAVGGSKVLMGRIEALQRLMEAFWFWRSPRRLSMPSVCLAKPSSLVDVAFWLERSPLLWSAMPDEGVLAQVSISGHLKTELLLFLGSSLRRSGLKALEGASVFGSIEPSPDTPSNSADTPVVPDTACGSSSLIPSEGLQRSPTVALDVVCIDGIAKSLVARSPPSPAMPGEGVE